MPIFDVIDNYLPEEEFVELQKLFLSNNFPWYFSANVATTQDKGLHFYMIHRFYKEHQWMSRYNDVINPFLHKLKTKLRGIIRIKANLYPWSSELFVHPAHFDFEYPHQAAIFSINTNNGYTALEDGSKVKSVANRMLFFDGSRPHSSTTCTDAKARINIGFNYF